MNLESTGLQKRFWLVLVKFIQGMPDLFLEILYTVQNYLRWSIPADSK